MKNDRYAHLLKNVEKPGRYIGGEYGEVVKDKNSVDLRFCFCFPDIYEIGMSNLGMKILTAILNNTDYCWCERCFAPWADMEEQLRKTKTPLFALESGDPLTEFDIIGFTLQYELSYTNALNMLDLAGIPLYAADRGDDLNAYPLIIAGGPCAYNPEPLAPFFDLFAIGEGEESLPELAELYLECKKQNMKKSDFLRKAARLEGCYVPSLYEVTYLADGRIDKVTPKYDDVPAKVKKRVVQDLDKAYYPTQPTVPYLDVVHDRIMLEVVRGCIRGCRFCQAGMVYRPYREKSPEALDRCAQALFAHTGYSEISLSSLSISDYSELDPLIDRLLKWTDDKKVSLSLPSMRIDAFYEQLMKKVMSVRKSGLTFAPEAGTQRLRDVINKNITEEEILIACRKAFDAGRNELKLYFMNGLPTETDEDIVGIAELAQKIVDLFYSEKRPHRSVEVTVSVSCFVPKPFTPFQWEPQDSLESLERKQALLKNSIRTKKITYKYHDAKTSRLECVFARGDRRLAPALAEAVRQGQRFDSWDEFFDYDKWMKIFEQTGVDPDFYTTRRIGFDETLPWDHIDIGVTKRFLRREAEKAYAGVPTPDCRTQCSGCGVKCLERNIKL
ncbi:MAG TPA: TIGR03960 family B12-binding radical SAM protein [Bacillota bacterium]|nr:TIGR03960 family B12-binding radical SAM protein [Bacillota bacterium]HOK68757.1 TIGR03960 family B12-binding radical SAM protein [Bacillota bacterium]HPP85598.1 TIGR03960 family B12-binding radical SAM protein [Bacillota bacterium]